MEESVSEFIMRTCRLFRKSSVDVFESIDLVDAIHLYKEGVRIVCGSSAEFFIQPLHSCIDDIDFCHIKPKSLVFANERAVLPYKVRHFAATIDCFFMEQYHDLPGFVRLRHFGQMRYDWERRTFEFIPATLVTTIRMDASDTVKRSKKWIMVGPASRSYSSNSRRLTDDVESIWCPQWPSEAAGWLVRPRKYGWPTIAVVHDIVQNGCHVVFAKHPSCRDDVYQGRLSFSLAEVMLLQSWTPVQQIVYHMLRFFAKRELISQDCPKEEEVLCTYHLKTLMLWSCEEMSPEWWKSSSVIHLCSNLLQKLARWLKETRLPNYFIPGANLFYEHFDGRIVNETINSLHYLSDPNTLSLWFLQHYMQPRFLDALDAGNTLNILSYEYLLQVCEAIKADDPKYMDRYVSFRFILNMKIAQHTLNIGFFRSYIDFSETIFRIGLFRANSREFRLSAEMESCFCPYGSTLRILHAARLLDSTEMHYDNEWFVEVIRQATIKPKRFRSKHHNQPKPLITGLNRCHFYLIKAQGLMENLQGSNNSEPEFNVVSEISKVLLSKALEFEDSNTTYDIFKTALSYMSGLHFAASEHEIVLDLCSRVIMSDKPQEGDTEALNSSCLLFIDDISMIIGFYLIFLTIKNPSLRYTRRPFFLDMRLTAELFADYLTISSIEGTTGSFVLERSSQTPKFPLDVILIMITDLRYSKISKKTKNALRFYQRIDPVNKLKTINEICIKSSKDITQLLMEYSLENMTSFYNAICKDFGIDCSTVECYRAAYLYKYRKYPEVLHLCEQIMDEPGVKKEFKEFIIANVTVVPPLDCHFDNEVQCLLGFHTLLCYLSPSNDYLRHLEHSDTSTFQHHFARLIYSKLSKEPLISEFLLDPYSVKCHYYLRKRFLARYLRVRCLLDNKCPRSEVMFQFNQLNASLPFEYIIRQFLEQKLRHF